MIDISVCDEEGNALVDFEPIAPIVPNVGDVIVVGTIKTSFKATVTKRVIAYYPGGMHVNLVCSSIREV